MELNGTKEKTLLKSNHISFIYKITITPPQWALQSVQWTTSSVLRPSIRVRKKLACWWGKKNDHWKWFALKLYVCLTNTSQTLSTVLSCLFPPFLYFLLQVLVVDMKDSLGLYLMVFILSVHIFLPMYFSWLTDWVMEVWLTAGNPLCLLHDGCTQPSTAASTRVFRLQWWATHPGPPKHTYRFTKYSLFHWPWVKTHMYDT